MYAPTQIKAPVLFNAPHSGRIYPQDFLDEIALDPMRIRRSEDAFVDELFQGVIRAGVPLLSARFPRAYVDVNREPYELDPSMFDGPLPDYANVTSMRVAGGLGTIARIVSETDVIYRGRLSVTDALGRIEKLYKPYHATLKNTLQSLRRRFGIALLVDCHSMPSVRSGSDKRPDFILGDRFGTACDGIIVGLIQDHLKALGYSVVRNKPYAGGFITETYGTPEEGLHAVQIEINRSLYMNERRFVRGAGFAQVQADLMELSHAIVEYMADLTEHRDAAE
ncbi:MAG: N-formylglutamate amidohydrolase [Pseudomonadota bacterium]